VFSFQILQSQVSLKKLGKNANNHHILRSWVLSKDLKKVKVVFKLIAHRVFHQEP
jgi:hypothetical protein